VFQIKCAVALLDLGRALLRTGHHFLSNDTHPIVTNKAEITHMPQFESQRIIIGQNSTTLNLAGAHEK
jgi:hypothetical protein